MVDFSTRAGQELYEREVRRLMAFMDRQRAEMLAAVLLWSPTDPGKRRIGEQEGK